MPHPGCRISSSQSVMSTLAKSLPGVDLGSSPLKSTSSVGSNMSIRGPSGVVRSGRSPLYHSMLSETSPAGLAAADDANVSRGRAAVVLETAAAFGRKYIGQHEATVAATCEPCGGKQSTADAGRSVTPTTKHLNHQTPTDRLKKLFPMTADAMVGYT